MPETRVRDALVRWYRKHQRDLPWRRTRDPYAIWISEIMLQQTQVATVIPYYHAFLERFPDIAALAAAGEDDVLARWTGLGYYRRARSLHRAAREVRDAHGGAIPADAATLRTLPGIGRYTAGAIASLAFGKPEPILDGNVRRVLARCFAVDGAALGAAAERAALWNLAAELVVGPAPGDLNQALMELGATVCTPREPSCGVCPLARACAARAANAVARYPTTTPRRKTESVRVGVAVILRGAAVLLERPDGANPLRGTWDLPAVELEADGRAVDALTAGLSRRHRLDVSLSTCLGRATHGILHRRLKLEAHRGTLRRGRVRGASDLAWVPLDSLGDHPISGATRKILRLTRTAR